MLAVKLVNSSIEIILTLNSELDIQFIPKLIRRLRQEINGLDIDTSTKYECSRSLDLRVLKIKASRPAWQSSWIAEIRVICPDAWKPDDDKIQLICNYIFGPKRKVLNQKQDALDAAEKINLRVRSAFEKLSENIEFQELFTLT